MASLTTLAMLLVVAAEPAPAERAAVIVSTTATGAVAGGTGGFLLAAAAVSALRTSEQQSLPSLIGAPMIGTFAGGLGGLAVGTLLQPSIDDVALVTSGLACGALVGFELQLAAFDGSKDVRSVPLRFAAPLVGGLLLGGAAAATAPLFDAADDDVALANSALLWGSAVGALVALEGDALGLGVAQGAVIVGGLGVLPWLTVLALSPLLDIDRIASWLIDVAALTGLALGAAVGLGLAPHGPALAAGGLLLGVGGGVAAALAVTPWLHSAPSPTIAPLQLSWQQARRGALAPVVSVHLSF